MILIHSSPPLDKVDTDRQKNLLKERLSPFFINDDDFMVSTETNLQLLKDIIINHKLYLFYVDSVQKLRLSPTEIIELITFLLINGNDGNGCEFQSEKEQLYFNKDNIDDVDSMISEIFKDHLVLS